jgi:hypothetical protein
MGESTQGKKGSEGVGSRELVVEGYLGVLHCYRNARSGQSENGRREETDGREKKTYREGESGTLLDGSRVGNST